MAYDSAAHRDLELYLENDRELYERQGLLFKNYGRKLKKGKYNRAAAERGVLNLIITPAARKYTKEMGGNSRTLFPMRIRKGLAKGQARSMLRGLLDEQHSRW